MIVVAILALYAIHLLLDLCDQTGVKSYEKLGYIAFGKPGRVSNVFYVFLLIFYAFLFPRTTKYLYPLTDPGGVKMFMTPSRRLKMKYTSEVLLKLSHCWINLRTV